MAFNEKLPEWHNAGVEPPESKKSEGWQPDDKPPADWFNWLFNRIYKALTEIRNILGGHVDATAPHSGHETPAGATAKASTAETNAKSYTDNHAESKTTHGIGSGYYVAKTSRSDQLPAYADIQGKPSSFPPDKHKNSHASGGSDALSPADIGAETPAGAQAKVDAHGNRTDNPHSVTKSQVGLGSVSNYGVATQSEAETGNANNKYMTPQRTKQAIDALQAVKSVAGKTGVVTLSKSDVGLANVDNVKQASKEEFDAHLAESATDAVRPHGMGSIADKNYEIGTWTPEITFGEGNAGITYQYRRGRYVRIGNLVTLFFDLALTSKGSEAGDLYVRGLPFISSPNPPVFKNSVGRILLASYPNGYSGVHHYLALNDNKIAIRFNPNLDGAFRVTDEYVGNSFVLEGQISYLI